MAIYLYIGFGALCMDGFLTINTDGKNILLVLSAKKNMKKRGS